MSKNRWKHAGALLTVAAFLTTGCTSLQSVPLSQTSQGVERPDIKVGEAVVVKKKDGATQKFKVTEVDDDALVGQDVRIPYGEMKSLEVQRGEGTHVNKTAIIVGAAIVGAIAIAAAAGGGSGGGSGY